MPLSLMPEAMAATRRKFMFRGEVQCICVVQSFKEGEISPEEAHEIGVETASELYGKLYEVLVCTHVNTVHIHNHFVVNNVSNRDGLALSSCNIYRDFCAVSNRICEEHGKSVIKGGTRSASSRGNGYYIRKAGGKTISDRLRDRLDYAESVSSSEREFEEVLRRMGCRIVRNPDPDRNGLAVDGVEHPFRLVSFGRQYRWRSMMGRVISNRPSHIPFEERDSASLKASLMAVGCADGPYARLSAYLDFLRKYAGCETVLVRCCPELWKEMNRTENYEKYLDFMREKGIFSHDDMNAAESENASAVCEIQEKRYGIKLRDSLARYYGDRAAHEACREERMSLSAGLKPFLAERRILSEIRKAMDKALEITARTAENELDRKDVEELVIRSRER